MLKYAWIPLAIAAIALSVVLFQTRSTLDETIIARDTAHQEIGDLNSNIDDLTELSNRKSTQIANLEAESQNKSATIVSRDKSIATLEDEVESLNQSLAGRRSEIADLQNLNEQAQAEITSNLEEIQSLETDNESLSVKLETSQETNADLDRQITRISNSLHLANNKIASLEALEGEYGETIKTLREEISVLEDAREALVLRQVETDFACTGSMEPVITCLDVGIWNRNWTEDDLVLGAVVSYKDKDGGHTAHRIIDKKPGYILTKGDNGLYTSQNDGWIAIDKVNYYLIDLIQNVNTHNADLRNEVNEAWNKFKKFHRQICGDRPSGGCTSSASNVRRWERLQCEAFAAISKAKGEFAPCLKIN